MEKLIELSIPLIGVLLGSIISGAGAVVRARSERKKAIAIALSDLLEIRHYINAVNVAIREIRNNFNIPHEQMAIFREFVISSFPLDEKIHERYDAAISTLAGISPILAFQLRSRNLAPEFLLKLNSYIAGVGVEPEHSEGIFTTLQELIVPILNEAVIDLAAEYSLITKLKVKNIIKNSDNIPDEVKDCIEKISGVASA